MLEAELLSLPVANFQTEVGHPTGLPYPAKESRGNSCHPKATRNITKVLELATLNYCEHCRACIQKRQKRRILQEKSIFGVLFKALFEQSTLIGSGSVV